MNAAARASGGQPEDLAHASDAPILHEEKFLGRRITRGLRHPWLRGPGRCGWHARGGLGADRPAPPRAASGIRAFGSAARTAGSLSAGARNAAVVHLSKTLAWELGPFGITVNAVHPGTTATEAVLARLDAQGAARGMAPSAVREEVAGQVAIRRLATPDDVACVVTFLCSPLAGAVTGEVVAAGGGTDRAVRY